VEAASPSPGPAAPITTKYKLHWHILFTHFPVGTFAGAFLFMTLHVVTQNSCYSQAAYVSLIAGLAVLIPTTATGWYTWRRQYKGFKNRLFRIKIWTSFAMIPLCIGLVAFQTIYPFAVLDVTHSWAHLVYFSGVVLLMIGSVVEGFWGARLHHR
jgi:hypothetical protein